MTTKEWKNRWKPVGPAILMAFVMMPLLAASLPAAGGHDDHSARGNGGMVMGDPQATGAFEHTETAEGIKAEFQIMSLASMNMQDPGGATHHVMVNFRNAATGDPIGEAVGRIKVIGPSGKESVADLKDYSGTYAANVSFDEPGRYGIICLAKVGDEKPLYKFWYPYGQ